MREQVHDHELDEWPELEVLCIRARTSHSRCNILRAKYYIQRRKVNLREEKGESTIDSCIWKIYFRKILILSVFLL